MFKNATVFRIAASWNPNANAIEAGLQNAKFVPCGPTDLRSSGWSEPRGIDHGPLLENVSGQWILRMMTEKKDLPGSVVQQAVEEQCKLIEENEGRKPGKKEKRDIKQSVILSLLPKAFAKRSSVNIWIDQRARLLYIDSTSNGVTDAVITALVKGIEDFAVSLINTTMSPGGAMATWLVEREINEQFDFGRECELQASDESKACVKYARHNLDIVEIGEHIKMGKIPKTLSITWNDKVNFVLNHAMQLKKIKLLEDGTGEQGTNEHEDGFDGDVAIITGELSQVVPDLIAVLGGEAELGAM
jgi:recombination associated protein RdgC